MFAGGIFFGFGGRCGYALLVLFVLAEWREIVGLLWGEWVGK